MRFRAWFWLLLLVTTSAIIAAFGGAHAASKSDVSKIWKPLPVGGGGWLTGIQVSPDGRVRVVRADTYGAYVWNESRGEWTQLVTADSMPFAVWGQDRDAGVYEISLAPSAPNRMYMAFAGSIFRSDSAGEHWIRTGFPKTQMDANDDFRTFGAKMAVDPVNADVVYVGTQKAGLLTTSDGGRTWHNVAAVPPSKAASNGKFPGLAGIAFDRSGGTSGRRTKFIYAASCGSGVFFSGDAGTSWTPLPGGPLCIRQGKVSNDGAYYAVDEDGTSIWRYGHNAWTRITPESERSPKGTWATVAIDPHEPRRIVAAKQGGSIYLSVDRGGNWTELTPKGPRRTASDVPWLAWTNENYMSVGDLLFDPVRVDTLWFAEGIGVWQARIESDGSPLTFVSQTAGIEQLVANQIIVPPGGKPVLASWDRPIFYLNEPGRYPSTHGPDNERAIVTGWSVDYAPSEPSFVAAIMDWWGVEKSGFSKDGGRSWTPFPARPPTINNGKIGGSIAVSSPNNMVWVPSNNSNPYYTKDGGVHWIPLLFAGVPREGETGWGFGYFLNRQIVAADRVRPNTFYLYNSRTGLYRSRDGGEHWDLVYEGEIAPYSGFNAKLRSVPGHAGHLFFTSGEQGGPDDLHPAHNPFMRSTDGGETWDVVEGVQEVRAFGFGKGPGEYPAIFVAGWVDGKYGLWRSDTQGISWTKIGEFPNGILSHVTTIEGDLDREGQVYVGFGGAGYAESSGRSAR